MIGVPLLFCYTYSKIYPNELHQQNQSFLTIDFIDKSLRNVEIMLCHLISFSKLGSDETILDAFVRIIVRASVSMVRMTTPLPGGVDIMLKIILESASS